MEVRTLKLISIPIILIVNFVIGILPYFLINSKLRTSNRRKAYNVSDNIDTVFVSPTMKRFLTLANFFCGGVFLATSLIGLYPTVNSKFNEILRKNSSIPEYPYAGLSLAIGFFLVWILEILVHKCLHCHTHSHDHNNSVKKYQENNDGQKNSNLVKVTSFNSQTPNLYPDDQANQPQPSDCLINPEDVTDDDKLNISESIQVTIPIETHETHSHVPLNGNLLGSIMLTFALGSHSIIEGLGYAMIGDLSMTINMLITVLIHESICALSLGVNLASKKTPIATSMSLLLTFAALIPAGIGIGMAVNLGLEKNLVGEVVTAILQGVAAGTFIYVVFMEILPAEIVQRKDATLKVVLMIIGFSIIASMKIFHTHGDKSLLSMNCTTNLSYSSPMPRHTHL